MEKEFKIYLKNRVNQDYRLELIIKGVLYGEDKDIGENKIIMDKTILTPEQYGEVYKKLNEIYELLYLK